MKQNIKRGIVLVILLLLSVSLVAGQNTMFMFNPFSGVLDFVLDVNQTGDNLTADFFFGDGSLLTGIVSGGTDTNCSAGGSCSTVAYVNRSNSGYLNVTEWMRAMFYYNSSGALDWITPANVFDIDYEDIESDLNTYVDIGGDTMTSNLHIEGDINATGRAYISPIGSTTYLGWGNLTGYPTACEVNETITLFGDTLTCSDISINESFITDLHVVGASCGGTDKVSGVQTNGSLTCSTDQNSGGGADTNCSVGGSCSVGIPS